MEETMILFASDTSTKSLSIAICRDEELIGGMTERTGVTHSQTYMPAILELLKDNGMHFSDIDLFACTVGPGSYTGIRIGVATTKTMAYASRKGAIGVSTLETLAFAQQGEGRLVCPILDARNRRVFSGGYLSGDPVLSEANRSIEELLDELAVFLGTSACDQQKETSTPKNEKAAVDVIFCGDAARLYREDPDVRARLESLIGSGRITAAVFLDTVPEAADTARIACRRFLACGGDPALSDPFALEARYLSPSQAERMKNR
jgi:tRNA threonylcarbamoyladenosine biosynthesis protein TsaB